MSLVTGHARVYINFGRLVADCPLDCGGAVMVQPKQSTFFCQGAGGCGHMAPLDWPSDIDELVEALAGRLPKHRNWFPAGHPLALRAGCPHGQTPAELREETAANTKGK